MACTCMPAGFAADCSATVVVADAVFAPVRIGRTVSALLDAVALVTAPAALPVAAGIVARSSRVTGVWRTFSGSSTLFAAFSSGPRIALMPVIVGSVLSFGSANAGCSTSAPAPRVASNEGMSSTAGIVKLSSGIGSFRAVV